MGPARRTTWPGGGGFSPGGLEEVWNGRSHQPPLSSPQGHPSLMNLRRCLTYVFIPQMLIKHAFSERAQLTSGAQKEVRVSWGFHCGLSLPATLPSAGIPAPPFIHQVLTALTSRCLSSTPSFGLSRPFVGAVLSLGLRKTDSFSS